MDRSVVGLADRYPDEVSRIIAGRAGGRRLSTPTHDRTRPTSDLVRESAFNLIADWAGTVGEPAESMLERFSLLDLYGGTGAIALEAASRGAGPVVCVEKDRSTAALARGNARATDLPIDVVTSSAGVRGLTSARMASDARAALDTKPFRCRNLMPDV